MKRYGNLFDLAFTPENLYIAYLNARAGKRKKQACFTFETRLGENLANLHRELHDGTYKPLPYYQFTVYEPKERVIYAPSFRDIVVQHAIYRIVYPIFNAGFIDTSFACRVGYGTHRASDKTLAAIRRYSDNHYVLKLDIRKFFYSINRFILRQFLLRKIKDVRFVEVMMCFANYEKPLGIPIGNLLSQLYALIYLNPLDYFVKRILKIKDYFRYVDDIVLIGLSHTHCLDYRDRIIQFLKEKLQLQLSRSTISKIKHGINFVGYRTWKKGRLIRKYSLYKFKNCLKKAKWASVVSILGHAKNTISLVFMKKLLKEELNGKDLSIYKSDRCLHYLLRTVAV